MSVKLNTRQMLVAFIYIGRVCLNHHYKKAVILLDNSFFIIYFKCSITSNNESTIFSVLEANSSSGYFISGTQMTSMFPA